MIGGMHQDEKYPWLPVPHKKGPDRSPYEVTRQPASASEMSSEGADPLAAPQIDHRMGNS